MRIIEKLNLIEQKLLGINPASFQSLCCDYLTRKYPILKNCIQEYGKSLGADKSKPGVPDIYFKLPSGKYVYVECNTEKGNVFKKLKNDLKKCLNSKIPDDDIETIFLLFTGNSLSPNEFNELRESVEKRNIVLEIIGIDTLKRDLRIDFQILAEQYLDISIDSGQILDERSFLQTQSNNKLATGLEQTIIGRQEEIQKTIQLLSSKDIVVLNGSSGVGKTKIGLEVCRNWCNIYPHFHAKFISPKTGKLNQEIQYHFENNSDYIILVDDAFRIEDIENLIFFNQNRLKKLKLLLTVRDFALRKIQRIFEHLQLPIFEEVKVSRLSNESIDTILNEKGVTSPTCQIKINRIVNGNPRLALMAAEQALKVNNCAALNDVSDIYESYFKPYIDDRKIDHKNIKVLGILAAFKVIQNDNIELHSKIEEAFGITKNELWDSFIELYENELVEFNDAERCDIVRISDQTLASYIFFQVFIKRKLLNFSQLIKYFFKDNKGRIRDALRPILETYGYENIKTAIKPFVDEARKSIENDSIENKLDFYLEFSFCQENEILTFLGNVLSETETIPFKELDFKESYRLYYGLGYKYLELAKCLKRNSRNTTFAVQLVLKYLEKQPYIFKETVKYFQEAAYFHLDDAENNYQIQVKLFEVLLSKVKLQNEFLPIYKELLKEISGKYLQIIAKGIYHRESYDKLRIFSQKIFDLPAWQAQRKEIWRYIITLIDIDMNSFEKIYTDALDLGYYKRINSTLLHNESKFVLELFNTQLNPEQLSHCLIVHKYLEYLGCCNIRTKQFNHIFQKFTTKTFRHHKILTLSYNSYSRRLRKKERLNKHNEIAHFVNRYTIKKTKYYSEKQYLEIFDSFSKSIIAFPHSDQVWKLSLIFKSLFYVSKSKFIEVIKVFFASGNIGKFKCDEVVGLLLKCYEGEEELLWSLIESYEFECKEDWKIDFLLQLPEASIRKIHFTRLKKCITGINLLSLNQTQLNSLKSYKNQLRNDAFVKIFNIIERRCKTNHLKFYSYVLIEQFADEFSSNITLLKKIYYHLQQILHNSDHDGEDFKILLKMDDRFLSEYLAYSFPKKYTINRTHRISKNWSFLWGFDDYEEKLSYLFYFIINNTSYYDTHSFLEDIFTPRGDVARSEKISAFLKKIIENDSNNEKAMKLIFKIVVECIPEQKTSFFEYFIQYNSSLEIFSQLASHPTLMVYRNGSRIFELMRKIEFWEHIRGILPDDIEYLKHHNYINNCIEYVKRDIEFEKRQSFWRDY